MINIDKSYQTLLHKILQDGKLRENRTGTDTYSIFSHTLEIDMACGFPLLTTKKMFTKAIIHELLWFLKGDTNIKYLVDNDVNIWTSDAYKNFIGKDWYNTGYSKLTKSEFINKIKTDDDFAEKWGKLGPIYGKQWVDWEKEGKTAIGWEHGAPTHFKSNNINQIERAINMLKNNPTGRRIMVSAWNVAEIDDMTLPPCHWAFELYTEELTTREQETLSHQYAGTDWLDQPETPTRRLSLKWHQRSVDTFLGLPFNIASYGLLLNMIAQQTNMVAGTLIGDLTNVHIYTNHMDQCLEQVGREPMELPKLELNKAEDIFSYTFDDFKILDYKSHPPIKGEISV